MPPTALLPHVIGHRGAAAVAPENTVAGIRAAAAAGATWVEFDVRLSADDVPVLLHDATLKRTTGAKKVLAAATYAEIAELDAGSWFGPGFAGEKLATLDGAFETLSRLGLGANVEIKPDLRRADRVAEAILDCLARHVGPPVIVSSLDERMLAAVRRRDADVRLGLLLRHRRHAWRSIAEGLGCVTIHCNNRWAGPRDIDRYRAAGFGVGVFTVNDPARAAALIGYGALGVFSDCPGDLIRRLGGPPRRNAA